MLKTSEDGKVSGISFTISGEGYHEVKTTNEDGVIDISDLNPGVYTVTEQVIGLMICGLTGIAGTTIVCLRKRRKNKNDQ